MARLLLVGLLAVFAADAAAGSRGVSPPRCTSKHLLSGLRTKDAGAAARIEVPVRNSGAPCTLGGSVTIVVKQGAYPAAVSGNPLRIQFSGVLRRGQTRLTKALWSNWCSSRTRLHVVLRDAEGTMSVPFLDLPICIDRRRPSRLVLIG